MFSPNTWWLVSLSFAGRCSDKDLCGNYKEILNEHGSHAIHGVIAYEGYSAGKPACIHSRVHWFTHSFIYSPTHSFTQSFNHEHRMLGRLKKPARYVQRQLIVSSKFRVSLQSHPDQHSCRVSEKQACTARPFLLCDKADLNGWCVYLAEQPC